MTLGVAVLDGCRRVAVCGVPRSSERDNNRWWLGPRRCAGYVNPKVPALKGIRPVTYAGIEIVVYNSASLTIDRLTHPRDQAIHGSCMIHTWIIWVENWLRMGHTWIMYWSRGSFMGHVWVIHGSCTGHVSHVLWVIWVNRWSWIGHT